MKTHIATLHFKQGHLRSAFGALDSKFFEDGDTYLSINVKIPKGYRLLKKNESLDGKTFRSLQQAEAGHPIITNGFAWTNDMTNTRANLGDIVIVKEKTKKDELLEQIAVLEKQVKELED